MSGGQSSEGFLVDHYHSLARRLSTPGNYLPNCFDCYGNNWEDGLENGNTINLGKTLEDLRTKLKC